MCFRKKIKDGYFTKVRGAKTPVGSHITYIEDCEYVSPIYKWYPIYQLGKICENPMTHVSSVVIIRV